MSKKYSIVALVLLIGLVAFYYFSPAQREARFVEELVNRNMTTRGGIEAWKNVTTLRLSGQMDVGQGMYLPYVLEQKRPNKMCLEFIFNKQTTIQCSNGKSGWKSIPFRGRTAPEPMTEKEFLVMADSADIYGVLYDYAARGITIESLGNELVSEQDTHKLLITLPAGEKRWLYLDVKTALEVKLETLRPVAGKDRVVETFYDDWQETEGLLISRRQNTRTMGQSETHFITVETVDVNPSIRDAIFEMPEAEDKVQQGN